MLKYWWIKSDLMKILSWIVLFALVVIVPFGSWYYLRQGLDYRKDALKNLEIKSKLDSTGSMDSLFLGKTTLIVLKKNAEVRKALMPIIDQFNDAYTFQVVSDSAVHAEVMITELSSNELLANKKYAFILVDTSGYIRNYYGQSREDLKNLVEHLAVLLPNPKEPDIKLKNQQK